MKPNRNSSKLLAAAVTAVAMALPTLSSAQTFQIFGMPDHDQRRA